MKHTLPILTALLALANTACTPELFKGMESCDAETVRRADLYPIQIEAGQSIVYSLELTMHDNTVNCLLMVEPDEACNSLKLVCTSVFGTTILDANISDKGMLIYDCADQLKHKKMLKLLEKDLQTLFIKNLKSDPSPCKTYKQYYVNTTSAIATDTILSYSGYRIKTTKGKCDFKTNEVEQKLESIATEGKLTKSNMQLTYKDGSFLPNTIKIEHPVLKLSMYMELQDQE